MVSSQTRRTTIYRREKHRHLDPDPGHFVPGETHALEVG